MFTHGPSDRVQIRRVGQLQSPAVCLLCGNGTHQEGYVDLDTFYEWEGQQYLCFTCVKQVAELIGCIIPNEAEHLKELSETIAKENAELREKLENAEQRLAVYDAAIRLATDSVPVTSADFDLPASEEPEESQPDVTGTPDVGETEQPEPSESGEGTGSDVLTRIKLSDFTL